MDTEYLNRFEERLQQELLRLCTDYHVLDGTLLATEDLDNRWHDLAPEYVADAVEQIRDYPVVSVAWAAYLGLGVAFAGTKTGRPAQRLLISRTTESRDLTIWMNTSCAICSACRSTVKRPASWRTSSAAADKLPWD